MEQAENALHEALVEDIFGEAGQSVIIEAGLSGEEVSVLAFCDQDTVLPMVVAQDHKAVFDDDRGPNTGGMGCYAPAPFVNSTELEDIAETILQPTIEGMREEGTPFRGVLYAGLMLTEDGPQVLEYNTRFGDPETQVILPLLDADLFEILQACVDDTLDKVSIRWLPEACVCVVCASQGYPGNYRKGLPIMGLAEVEKEGLMIFHAGTRQEGGNVVTSGGRVLGITCWASDLPIAIARAYDAVRAIHFDGVHYRRDIGAKASRKEISGI
jgi:phosphoribosylamine--glycine ligase